MCTMADDRGLVLTEAAHYTDLTCGTENLSPYSVSSGYPEHTAYYQPQDYEWQHQQQQQHHRQQPILTSTHQQMLEPSDKHYYPTYQDNSPGSAGDSTPHGCFPGYSHPPHHTDFYSPVSHGLWTPSPSAPLGTTSGPDSLMSTQMGQHHRFFSGIDLSQHPPHPLHPHHQGTPSTPTAPVVKPKRKRVQSHTQRKAANVRERRRMFHLNEAFDELRKRLPAFNYEKRLSRIETLRLAMTYISFMKDVSVGEDPKSVKLKPHGAELSPLGGAHDILSSMFSGSSSGSNDERSILNDDSDDDVSNHSGGN